MSWSVSLKTWALISYLSSNDEESPLRGSRRAHKERTENFTAEQAVWARAKFDLVTSVKLIAPFPAALARNVAVQERPHITTHHICIYSNISATSPRMSLSGGTSRSLRAIQGNLGVSIRIERKHRRRKELQLR